MSSVGGIVESVGEFMRDYMEPVLLPILERNVVPDGLVRVGVRREIEMEVQKTKKFTAEGLMEFKRKFVAELKSMPIAIAQDKANDQHYEIPEEYYKIVLGPHLKYSSGYWATPETTLEESEIAMLEMYCERAEIVDGQSLIDLGCGWGSVTLYMAAKYPNCKITSISNSASQREFIMATARARGNTNVNVFTGDIATFDLPVELHGSADRVISVEMFEHMKNYKLLMEKVSHWIKPGGKLFVHIFTHKEVPGHYEKGWMTDTFFSGGTLPSDDLLLYFQDHLRIESHWRVNGTHYQRTLEEWLVRTDARKAEVMPVLARCYGEEHALKWFVYWRLFFIGCAEFFGIREGEEYMVSHYLFVKN